MESAKITIAYTEDIREALQDADLAIIATEWDHVKFLPLDVYVTYMKNPIVIDGRNCYPLSEIQHFPISYRSVGRPHVSNIHF
jgi:UDPglucose 6-dehydrogenase